MHWAATGSALDRHRTTAHEIETNLKHEHMKTSNLNSTAVRHEPTHDEIALAAFLAWEKEGRPPGRETACWLNAEAQLRQLHRQKTGATAAAPAAAAATAAATPRTPVAPARETKPGLNATKASDRQISVKPAANARPAAARRAA